MGRGAKSKFGGGCGGDAVKRRGCQGVFAGIAGAGRGSGNDGLAGGEDRSSEAAHGAMMRTIAAAAGGQAGFVVSQ